MEVRFWGTRGSIPTPGPASLRYGGNTSCVEVRTSDGTLFILDCGTGARSLGQHLVSTSRGPVKGHLLLSHTHWDHIQGFPFFAPLFARGNRFTIYGAASLDNHLNRVLAGQMEHTYFPVSLQELPSKIVFRELTEGTYAVGEATIKTHYLNHTCVCLGYRIEADGRSIVFATDNEPNGGPLKGDRTSDEPETTREYPSFVHREDQELAQYAADADLLIMDCQYTQEEYPAKVGWGHGTTDYVADLAHLAEVKRLALFHHDPSHSDDMVESMVEHCRERLQRRGARIEVFGAAEGLTVALD